MSATTAWASAMDAESAPMNPWSNTVGATLDSITPALLDFDQDLLRAGLYDWWISDPSVALDLTKKVSFISVAAAPAAAPAAGDHTPPAAGTPKAIKLYPASAWKSLLITMEFPRLSIHSIGFTGTIWFVKRYPGS